MGVFFGEKCLCRVYLPVDTKTFVKDGDASVCFGMVVVVAFVLEHCRIAHDCEAMGEASWDEELAVVVLGQ